MAILLRKPKPKPQPDTGHSNSVSPEAAQHNAKADGSASPSDAEYLTIKQVAGRLQVCTKTVHRLIRKLDIPVKRVGRQIRIPASYIELFMTKEW